MNTPTITFISNAENPDIGELNIPGVCSLEALYAHPNCPSIVKDTLEKHIHWQNRCETPLHLALNFKNKFLPFRAAMAVFGIGDIEEDEAITLKFGGWKSGSSMVRPTPAHTPIVSSFVRLKIKDGEVKKAKIAITGIEKRRLTQPDITMLIDKELTDQSITDFTKHISQTYAGFSDFNGSADYRKAMVAVTLERALQEVKNG